MLLYGGRVKTRYYGRRVEMLYYDRRVETCGMEGECRLCNISNVLTFEITFRVKGQCYPFPSERSKHYQQ